VKFCVGCGGGLFRSCPECEKENSVNQPFCDGCGTDVEGFVTAQEILQRMECYAQDLKWSRVVKEAKGFDEATRLLGEKGTELRSAIQRRNNFAKQILIEIKRLKAAILDIEQKMDTWGEDADEMILKLLGDLEKIQPLSPSFQMLEKLATQRIVKAKRVEKERIAKKKRAEAERLAEEKRVEAERLAKEKRVEAEQLAEEMRASAKWLAEKMRVEKERREGVAERKKAGKSKFLIISVIVSVVLCFIGIYLRYYY
jgi:hypothetical protein